MANKYLSEPIGDGGQLHVPTFKVTDSNGQIQEVSTNAEKAQVISKAFFPVKPNLNSAPVDYNYPLPINFMPDFTRECIQACIAKLLPYKANRPDEIPNIVLQRTINLIIDYLYYIFQAIFKLNVYHNHWQEFMMAVLRKPGKPSYEVPKAYQPIALLCTMA